MPNSLYELLAQQYGVVPVPIPVSTFVDRMGLNRPQYVTVPVMQAPRAGSVNIPLAEPVPMTWREAIERTGEQAAYGLLAPAHGLAKAIEDATGWQPPLMGAAERMARRTSARPVLAQPGYLQRSVMGAGRSLGQMLPLAGFTGSPLTGLAVAAPWWSLGEYPAQREDFSPVKAAFASIAQGATEMLMPNPVPFLRQTGPLGMFRNFAGETAENVAQGEIDALFHGEMPSLRRMMDTAIEGAGATGLLVGLGGLGLTHRGQPAPEPTGQLRLPLATPLPGSEVRNDYLSRVAEKVWNHTLNHGGATYSPLLGDRSKAKGYAVAAYPNREVVVPLEEFTPETLRSYISQNMDILGKDPKANLGTWVNNATGNVHLDVSKVDPSLEKAKQIGVLGDQYAIYDLLGGEEIWLKSLKSPDLDPGDPDNWVFTTQPNMAGHLFPERGVPVFTIERPGAKSWASAHFKPGDIRIVKQTVPDRKQEPIPSPYGGLMFPMKDEYVVEWHGTVQPMFGSSDTWEEAAAKIRDYERRIYGEATFPEREEDYIEPTYEEARKAVERPSKIIHKMPGLPDPRMIQAAKPSVDLTVPPEFADVFTKAQKIVEKQTKQQEELGKAGKVAAKEPSFEEKLIKTGIVSTEQMEPIGTVTPSLRDMSVALRKYASIRKHGKDVAFDHNGISEMIDQMEMAPLPKGFTLKKLEEALESNENSGSIVGAAVRDLEPQNARFYASLAFRAALGDPVAMVMARIMAAGQPSVSKAVGRQITKSLEESWIPYIHPNLQKDLESYSLFPEYEFPHKLEGYHSGKKEIMEAEGREHNRIMRKYAITKEEEEFLNRYDPRNSGRETSQLYEETTANYNKFLPFGKRFAADLGYNIGAEGKKVGIFDEEGNLIDTLTVKKHLNESDVLNLYDEELKRREAKKQRIEEKAGREGRFGALVGKPIVNPYFTGRVGVKKAVTALFNGKEIRAGNDRVVVVGDIAYYKLFGNVIAEYHTDTGTLVLDDAGWQTKSTKERLNAILIAIGEVPIHQKDYRWYRGTEVWTGSRLFDLYRQRTPLAMVNPYPMARAKAKGTETEKEIEERQLSLPSMPPESRHVTVSKKGDTITYSEGSTKIVGTFVNTYSDGKEVKSLLINDIIQQSDRRSYDIQNILDRIVLDMLDGKMRSVIVPTWWVSDEKLGNAVRYISARYQLGVHNMGSLAVMYPKISKKELKNIGGVAGFASDYKGRIPDIKLSEEFYRVELPKYKIPKPFWSGAAKFIVTEMDHKHKKIMMGLMEALEDQLGLPKVIRRLYNVVGQGSYLSPNIIAMADQENKAMSISISALDDLVKGKNAGDIVQTVLHELMHFASLRLDPSGQYIETPVYESPVFRVVPWTIKVTPPSVETEIRPVRVDVENADASPMIKELIEWNMNAGILEHKRDPLRKLLDYPLNTLYLTAYHMNNLIDDLVQSGAPEATAKAIVMGMPNNISGYTETFEDSINRVKAEIFAQLGSLYYYAPEYLRDNLPYAYNVFMEIDRNGQDATGPADWFVRLSASLRTPGTEGRRATLVRQNITGAHQQSFDFEPTRP